MRGYNRLVGSFHNMGTVLGPVAILILYAVALVKEPGRVSLPRVAGLLFRDAAVLFVRLGLAK